MDIWLLSSAIGNLTAIFLCRDLGRLFVIPMILNLGFDLCLSFGVLPDWDIRFTIAMHGMLFALWVIAISGMFASKVETVFGIALILLIFFFGIYPSLSSNPDKSVWIQQATHIIHVWLSAILLIVIFEISKSVIIARVRGRRVDLLTNPRKRFLIPISVWAAVIVIPPLIPNLASEWFVENRFHVAGNLLPWGWVILEFPFYWINRKLQQMY